MPGPLLIPALAAGASLLNTGIQAGTNAASRRWSEHMYERQRADALADWNMQNEYNSPIQQMARLKAGGLNPNLVYGHGADAQSTGPVRSSSVESWSPRAPQVDTSAFMGYYDIQLKEAAIDNAKAQNDLLLQEKLLKQLDLMKKTDEYHVNFGEQPSGLSYYQEFKEAQLNAIKSNIESMNARTKYTLDENERAALRNVNTLQEGVEKIATLRLGRQLTSEQIRSIHMDAELKQKELELRRAYNISSSDPVYIRMITYFLDKLGFKP